MAADLSEEPIVVYGCSETGHERSGNEDRYLITAPTDDALLLAVADGMGIEKGGAHAAEAIIRQMAGFKGLDQIHSRLGDLVRETDLAIYNTARVETGTTFSAVLLSHGFAHYAHVGDSRIYLLRNRKLIQITRDQNMAQFLVEEGKLSHEEARSHDSRHLLDQCVGCGHCKPDQDRLETNPGDIFLLTTDGVHNSIDIEEITEILLRRGNVRTKTQALLAAALKAGAWDDRTVVMAELTLFNTKNGICNFPRPNPEKFIL